MTSTQPGGAATPAGDINLGLVVTISMVATIGGFLFGFDSGVINGTFDGLKLAFDSTTGETGWFVASMLLGCAAGAALAGTLSDWFGRRSMLMVAAVLFIVSAWGSGVANGSFEFIIYRVLGGLAVGGASVMAPAYISEVAPARMRGRLSSIQQVAIIFGLFMAFLSNYLIAGSAGSAVSEWFFGFEAWRWMFWIELVPAAVFLFALFTIPESPRYLVAKRKSDEARAVLGRLIGADRAAAKVAEIEQTLENDHRPRLTDILSKTSGVKPIVWVGIGLAVFQQLVGINVIFYYGAVLWQAAGFTEADALLTNVLSGALSIGAVVLGLLVIDRIGRKPMLLIGSAGMALTLGITAYAFSTGELVDGALQLDPDNGRLALISANAYVMFFNFSWGPVMWVMLGEMFPNQIRGSGLAVAGFFQWVANFIITRTFPQMLEAPGVGLVGAYGVYTFFALVSVFFVLFAVRETKGKELEEMTE